jgi:hypothetical protein
MQKLIIIIRRDKINSKQVNLYVRQIFQIYNVNKIRNHNLYKAIFHDLFELKQEHWNVLISRTWNVVNIVCYIQEYWISHSKRKEIRAKLMFQTIRTLFYQNWTMNQIKFIEKKYRKLFSIIQNRKMKLLRNQQSNRNYFILSIEFSSFQFSITSIFASNLAFVFALASISTWLLVVNQKSVNQKNVEE